MHVYLYVIYIGKRKLPLKSPQIPVKEEETIQQYRLDSDTKKQLNSLLTTIEEADVKQCFAMAVTDEEGLTIVYHMYTCLTFIILFDFRYYIMISYVYI
jgi:hypothetical protein